MEQAQTRVDHRYAVFAAGRFDLGVTRRATRLGDELHAVTAGVVDVVSEGDEAIRDQGNAAQLGAPGAFVVVGQRL